MSELQVNEQGDEGVDVDGDIIQRCVMKGQASTNFHENFKNGQ